MFSVQYGWNLVWGQLMLLPNSCFFPALALLLACSQLAPALPCPHDADDIPANSQGPSPVCQALMKVPNSPRSQYVINVELWTQNLSVSFHGAAEILWQWMRFDGLFYGMIEWVNDCSDSFSADRVQQLICENNGWENDCSDSLPAECPVNTSLEITVDLQKICNISTVFDTFQSPVENGPVNRFFQGFGGLEGIPYARDRHRRHERTTSNGIQSSIIERIIFKWSLNNPWIIL